MYLGSYESCGRSSGRRAHGDPGISLISHHGRYRWRGLEPAPRQMVEEHAGLCNLPCPPDQRGSLHPTSSQDSSQLETRGTWEAAAPTTLTWGPIPGLQALPQPCPCPLVPLDAPQNLHFSSPHRLARSDPRSPRPLQWTEELTLFLSCFSLLFLYLKL